MFELMLIFFATIGLAHIIVDSTIFNRYVKIPLANLLYKKVKTQLDNGREEDDFFLDNKGNKILKIDTWVRRRLAEIDEMINCYQCSGFWSGIFVGIIWLISTLDYMGWIRVLLYGMAGSYLAMMGATLLIFFNTGTSNGQNGSN